MNMKSFNLFDLQQNKVSELCKKYVEAAGHTHMHHRDPYRWWDYDVLKTSQPDDFTEWVSTEPGLISIIREAGVERNNALTEIAQRYCLNRIDAEKYLKTFIGYHPSYGGYICNIGAYKSHGFKHGEEHVISEAWDKIYYHIIRKRKANQQDIAKSVLKNIEKYQQRFSVQLEPGDFALLIKEHSDTFDPNRQRQQKSHSYVNSLDPNSSESQRFFSSPPVLGSGSQIVPNTRGYDKLLRGLMGTWYQAAISERAIAENKTEDQVRYDILSNPQFLSQIYKLTYKKWEEARERGDADAMGMTAPPKFTDASLQSKAGAQGYTGVLFNTEMAGQMKLRAEVVEALKEGITNPTDIAAKLNSNPQRLDQNKRRRNRKLEPILISEAEIMHQMSEISRHKTPDKDYDTYLQETKSSSESMEVTRGYDDFQTAFSMASLYFSGQMRDPVTGAVLSEGSASPLGDAGSFANFTSKGLQKLREDCVAKKTGQEIKKEEEKDTDKATEQEIKRDIGEEITEPIAEPTKPDIIAPKPNAQPVTQEEEEQEMNFLMSKTLKNLVKIATELDEENKNDAAEEVHKIIRKYEEGI